jgi:hypothetical protein
MDEPRDHHDEHQPGGPPAQSFSQDFKHTPIAARIPEKVGRGVFSTATMILQNGQEFVIDFLATMAQPQQVVARVILTPATFSQFVAALRINIGKFEQEFGPLPPHPPGQQHAGAMRPPGQPSAGAPPAAAASGSVMAAAGHQASAPPPTPQQPSVAELYDQLKFPDEMLGGTFANAVMIRHTPWEFCFDFIANFYPRSAVTARVYVTAGRVVSLLDAMSGAWQKFQQAISGGQGGGGAQ